MSKKIRVWKLGNLEQRVIPTQETVDKLSELIRDAKQSDEDVYDIVWGPDLEVIEVGCDCNCQDDEVEDVVCPPYGEPSGEIHWKAINHLKYIWYRGLTFLNSDILVRKHPWGHFYVIGPKEIKLSSRSFDTAIDAKHYAEKKFRKFYNKYFGE